MADDPVRARALRRVPQHHHGTPGRAAARLVRGAWRHSTDNERAFLDSDGDLLAALWRLMEGTTP